MNLWTNSEGQVLTDGMGRPIDCPDCPCEGGGEVPCSVIGCPETFAYTLKDDVSGVVYGPGTLTFNGTGYDGNVLEAGLGCSPDGGWGLTFFPPGLGTCGIPVNGIACPLPGTYQSNPECDYTLVIL